VLVGADGSVLAQLAAALAPAGPLLVLGSPGADGSGLVVDVDVGVQAELDAAAREVVRRWGSPATVVLAPAPVPSVALVDLDDRAWEKALDANLGTASRATRAFGPALVARGRAAIAMVAWRAPPGPGATVVAAVSGAVTLFARSLAADLGIHGVTVNAVHVPPGGVAAAAPAVALLRSPDATYVTGEVLEPMASGRDGTR
jgi:NAD(P)-dependent dehydrogenase (short-subunit alcohol dehydrogenase family)